MSSDNCNNNSYKRKLYGFMPHFSENSDEKLVFFNYPLSSLSFILALFAAGNSGRVTLQ